MFISHVGDPIERGPEAFIITILNTGKAFGPAADDEVNSASLGCQSRRLLDTPELVLENIRIDEVAAAVDGKQRQSLIGQQSSEVIDRPGMLDEIAVEDLDRFVSRRW